MGDAAQLSRIKLRRDQVLEVHFSQIPEPPPEMMKLPGVSKWFDAMRLSRDRDIQALNRLVNNLQISTNNTGDVPSG